MYIFSQSHRVGLAFCTCPEGLYSPYVGACAGSRQWVGGLCGDEVHRALGGTHGPVGVPTGKVYPAACERASSWRHVHKAVSRTCMPLMRSEPWLLCFWQLPAPKPCRSPQYSGWGGKEGASSAVSHTVGEIRHPLNTLLPSLVGAIVGRGDLCCCRAMPPWGGG